MRSLISERNKEGEKEKDTAAVKSTVVVKVLICRGLLRVENCAESEQGWGRDRHLLGMGLSLTSLAWYFVNQGLTSACSYSGRYWGGRGPKCG